MKSVYTIVELAKELGVKHAGGHRLVLSNDYQVGLAQDVFTLYKGREAVLKSTPKAVVSDLKAVLN